MVGEQFLDVFDARELALHERIVRIRDQDLAHSDFYHDRIHVKAEGADVWIRPGVDPSNASEGDIEVTMRHSLRATIRSLTREEMRSLAKMAQKLRERIKARGREISGPILAARGTAGFHDWFRLADVSPSDANDPPP